MAGHQLKPDLDLDAIAERPGLADDLPADVRAKLARRARIAMTALEPGPVVHTSAIANQPAEPELVTKLQAAEFLNQKEEWVKKHAHEIPGAVKLGHNWRFTREGLRQYVQQKVGRLR
jgi:hypothetical protein